jgi:mobilome CxxCx(11)CxxC protein
VAIAEPMIVKIRQQKINALAAKHMHVPLRRELSAWIMRVDLLALAVPILYFVIRFLAKGTQAGGFVEVVWEIIAVILLAMTIWKIVYKWEARAQKHSELIADNIALVRRADSLLNEAEEYSPQAVQSFLEEADRVERGDQDALAEVSTKDRQEAYRRGLMEFQPGIATTVCPVCNASPWHFNPGSCQACGNTPPHQRST